LADEVLVLAGLLAEKDWVLTGLNFSSCLVLLVVFGRQVQGEPPLIPRTTPDKVYDIRYWPRDTKREHMLVGGTNKRFQEVSWIETGLAVKPQNFCLKPPEKSAYRPFKATRKPLLDVTNDGYE